MTTEDKRFTKDNLKRLVEGELPWESVKNVIRMTPKDTDRFDKYIAVLQDKVPWDDQILLRISDHLYIVRKDKERIVKCDCGHEFDDYRINWKFQCRIFARRTDEEIAEVHTVKETRYNTDLVELREYYCPGCYALLATEVVPMGYPPMFEMLPDIDSLYRDLLGRPLDDENPDWFQEKTSELTAKWAKEE
jgi:acetone carboxylase gamma subunit